VSVRVHDELRALAVLNSKGRLAIIGQSKHLAPLAEFLRSKGLAPTVTGHAVGDEDTLVFNDGENAQNLNMLLNGWKEKYIRETESRDR
jgi:hypothetical protein